MIEAKQPVIAQYIVRSQVLYFQVVVSSSVSAALSHKSDLRALWLAAVHHCVANSGQFDIFSPLKKSAPRCSPANNARLFRVFSQGANSVIAKLVSVDTYTRTIRVAILVFIGCFLVRNSKRKKCVAR